MIGTDQKSPEMTRNDQTWPELVKNYQKWPEMARNGQKWPAIIVKWPFILSDSFLIRVFIVLSAHGIHKSIPKLNVIEVLFITISKKHSKKRVPFDAFLSF